MSPQRKYGFRPPQAFDDDQQSGAQGFHHPHRQGDLLEGVAFVHVEAAFHDDHRQPVQLAAHQAAAVAERRGPGEVRDGLVVERRLDVHGLHHAAQPGAEDDARVRRAVPVGTDCRRRFVDLVVQFEHFLPLLYRRHRSNSFYRDPSMPPDSLRRY